MWSLSEVLDGRTNDYEELGSNVKYSSRSTEHWACYGGSHQVSTPVSAVAQRHWNSGVHVTYLPEHIQSRSFEDQSMLLRNWDLVT